MMTTDAVLSIILGVMIVGVFIGGYIVASIIRTAREGMKREQEEE